MLRGRQGRVAVAAGYLAAWSLLVATAPGCYRVQYYTEATPNGQERWRWNHFFVWGVAGHGETDIRAECPHGIARAAVKHSFPNMLLSVLTLGIYTPTTTELWCAERGSEAKPPSTAPPPTARPRPTGSQPPRTAPGSPPPAGTPPGFEDERPTPNPAGGRGPS